MTLTSDNRYPKRTIHVSNEELEFYCKKFLGWRTKKHYKNMTSRFLNTSSTVYDYLIEQVYQSHQKKEKQSNE